MNPYLKLGIICACLTLAIIGLFFLSAWLFPVQEEAMTCADCKKHNIKPCKFNKEEWCKWRLKTWVK